MYMLQIYSDSVTRESAKFGMNVLLTYSIWLLRRAFMRPSTVRRVCFLIDIYVVTVAIVIFRMCVQGDL